LDGPCPLFSPYVRPSFSRASPISEDSEDTLGKVITAFAARLGAAKPKGDARLPVSSLSNDRIPDLVWQKALFVIQSAAENVILTAKSGVTVAYGNRRPTRSGERRVLPMGGRNDPVNIGHTIDRPDELTLRRPRPKPR
jgi:hypothetical protein